MLTKYCAKDFECYSNVFDSEMLKVQSKQDRFCREWSETFICCLFSILQTI